MKTIVWSIKETLQRYLRQSATSTLQCFNLCLWKTQILRLTLVLSLMLIATKCVENKQFRKLTTEGYLNENYAYEVFANVFVF